MHHLLTSHSQLCPLALRMGMIQQGERTKALEEERQCVPQEPRLYGNGDVPIDYLHTQ